MYGHMYEQVDEYTDGQMNTKKQKRQPANKSEWLVKNAPR